LVIAWTLLASDRMDLVRSSRSPQIVVQHFDEELKRLVPAK